MLKTPQAVKSVYPLGQMIEEGYGEASKCDCIRFQSKRTNTP